MNNTKKGTICNINTKGYGFIRPIESNSNKDDVFFHVSGLKGIKFEELDTNMRVCYIDNQTPKGINATEVTVDYFSYGYDNNIKN